MKPSMATRGGKCVKLTKLINYIMKKNRNKSLPGGLWLIKIWLNAESSLVFPVEFSGNKRQVILKGEAYFEVARNEHLPFVVASYFPDITLTFGLTASDFVWQGFEQGKKDGCKEWPIPGASTLSWRGEPLAYMPFVYEHPVYWQKIEEETKGSGDIERSTCLFIDSEKAREHTEEEMIKVENIKGKLFLIGADDDSFWEAGKYIRRMDQRLKERPHTCEYVPLVYEHGTHFVLPESMLRMALPVGLKFVMKFIFKAAKDYPNECEATRKDIDRRLSAALKEWIQE